METFDLMLLASSAIKEVHYYWEVVVWGYYLALY